ncbi:N(4)-(Beta-N-acetylglucosaminyl)-L-asparaginase-like [Chelonus insularis]|uniref:N(4)-(Beta-N-acetylglucosaminyl)-L-asparaginase- like n=1 Tax=Chelonus insularis TaxID=460826 RepID=UPI00158D290E|nr:N(4)-(Beta-N-acetylglucosaminyl)-L-asparaginase-like [Chelonus insularis]
MKRILLIVFLNVLLNNHLFTNAADNTPAKFPLVVITWDYLSATQTAWKILNEQKLSSIDAIEGACALCEEQQCRTTVGYGGSPDEAGETTLDAMIMDGVTMDVGAVGGLRNIKSAISVARKVLENTKHTLLTGSLATKFAIDMGFKSESLTTNVSLNMWQSWKQQNCQPNFWKNVSPDPSRSCGPYTPNKVLTTEQNEQSYSNEENHDTIGVIAIDSQGKIAAGTSTNGAKFKIPGRVGDSPVPGAGSYADQEVGAAAGTGDGDIMMRFLPSFLAVEEMRRGASPADAAATAIRRIAKHHSQFIAGVIALNKNGEYGAACHGIYRFPFYVSNPEFGSPQFLLADCIKSASPEVKNI